MEIILLLIFAVFLTLLSSKKNRKPSKTHVENKILERGETPGDLKRVKVKYVVDGDTVIVSENFSQLKLRLYAIDCPESAQPWGGTATAGLIKMIGRRYVHLESHGKDRYNRVLATLHVKNGQDWINVNERMVMLGHAWVMPENHIQLPKERKFKLNKLERWAKSKRVGLWKHDNPMPPWKWRRQLKAP